MEKGKSDRTLIYNHPIKIRVNLLRAGNDKFMAGKLGSFLVGLSLLLNRVKQKRVSSGKWKNKKQKARTRPRPRPRTRTEKENQNHKPIWK